MTVIENHCCDCAAPGYPCMGSACPNRRVPVFYCDNSRCSANLTGTDRLFVVGDSRSAVTAWMPWLSGWGWMPRI